MQAPVAEPIRISLSCHDGTGDFAVVDVAEDASYVLLSIRDAQEIRKLQREVADSESSGSKSDWWSDSWWPFADNGGGDLLVVDCVKGRLRGRFCVSRMRHAALPDSRSLYWN